MKPMLSYYRTRGWPAPWGGAPESRAIRMTPLSIRHLFNNIAFTPLSLLANGALNVWGNSFPAAEAQPLAGSINVSGVHFEFPAVDGETPDNIRCAGEGVEVPSGRYDWLYVLACSERRGGDHILIHYDDGMLDFALFEVPDFWPGAVGSRGEKEAVRFSSLHFPKHDQAGIEPAIWRVRVPIARELPVHWIELPNNVGMHVFSMTLVATMI